MLGRIGFLAIALLLAGCQSVPQSSAPFSAALRTPDPAEAQLSGRSDDPRYASIVVDARTGAILQAENADAPRYPASLTKMMTLYLLFEDLQAGRLTLDTPLTVSEEAASRPPSKLGLKAGSAIRVEDAVVAMTVRSANDVATVVAENLAGSEAAFAARMTRTAQAIGMRDTTFRNASGLPDPAQTTTARDMALLGRALQQRFPRHYAYFSLRGFSYDGRDYVSTNKLLGQLSGMDGIKTGYTRLSGYNLAASVRRGNRHLIVVVMGGSTGRSRDAHVAELVERHLR